MEPLQRLPAKLGWLIGFAGVLLIVGCTPPGSTRRNPAVGSVAADDITISVNSVLRPATDQVVEASLFNVRPEADQEYVRVVVSLSCASPFDTLCRIGLEDDFALVDQRGNAYEAKFLLIGVPGAIETGTWVSGTVKEGALFFIVDVDADDLVLRYEADFINEEFVYLTLP